MKINLTKSFKELGKEAAILISNSINKKLKEQYRVRLLLSTGASQFSMFEELIKADINWSRVDVFHLDEYIGLSVSHVASFRKYLKERFLNHVDIGSVCLVNGGAVLESELLRLEKAIREKPIDIGVIGIGENGHIAFNDPQADFETKEAYIKVILDQKCKVQQVNEGWFKDVEEVPESAISMSVHQIMQCKKIISCVPSQVKAEAVANTFKYSLNPNYPSTALKYHHDWTLFLDEESSSLFINK